MHDPRPLLKASFKGLAFEVDREAVEGGRFVAVHEYVRSEDFDAEDLGRRAPMVSVTAYLASDLVDAEASALFSVCTERGAGLLLIPGVPAGTYHCCKVKRSSEQDRLGLVSFDLEFIAAGSTGDFATPLFDLAAASAATALASLVRSCLELVRR